MRIKKALVEAKFIANSEDALKMADKMGKEDIVKIVDEGGEIPKRNLNNPKIEKFVNDLNALIASAVDSEGDALGVVDSSSTWEEPYVYLPIQYTNGNLKITSKSQYKNEPEVEVIARRNMEFDGVGTLRNIKKMYNLAIKRNTKTSSQPHMEESDVAGRSIEYGQREPELGDADWEEMYNIIKQNENIREDNESTGVVNVDNLRTDVAKFMDKLDLGQFKTIIAKIDKPQEQAEIIAAFGERIGIPRAKLPMIISSLKNISKGNEQI